MTRFKKGLIIFFSIIIALCITHSILKRNSTTYNTWIDKFAYNNLVEIIKNNNIERMYFSYGKQEDGTMYLEIVNITDIEKPELSFINSLWKYNTPPAKYIIEIQLDNRITMRFCTPDGEIFFISYDDRYFCVSSKQLTDFISAKNV